MYSFVHNRKLGVMMDEHHIFWMKMMMINEFHSLDEINDYYFWNWMDIIHYGQRIMCVCVFFYHGDATTNYLFNICSKCKLPFIILSNWCHIKFFVKIKDDGIKMKL